LGSGGSNAGAGGTPSATGGSAGAATGGNSGGAKGGAGGNAGASGGAISGGAAGNGGVASGGVAGSGGVNGGTGAGGGTTGGAVSGLPTRATILAPLRKANDYFMGKWPDPGADIVTDKARPSNIWTRGVYYEGLMGLQDVDPQARYIDYAVAWGTSHSWGLQGGTATRSADDQCAGQTYIDLYVLQKRPEQLRDIKANIDAMVAGSAVNDWTWIDAIQMSMPVFAKLGVLTGNANYFSKMYAFYHSSKALQGANGFYSTTYHLWWRDQDFDPPYKEPNGKSCYWSRGNGWVYAALVRVLDILPTTDSHRAEYLADFQAMSEALRPLQRTDGFWNVSLMDPTHFGGPEVSGTSLFVYGMAWGIRKGLLSEATYAPAVKLGWAAMASSVRSNGSLGYVQSTGKEPADGQPVTFDKLANFEDYGLGCFLLGGSEVWKLAAP
jgi:rhamnogalacturonyl hydrolase YesR